MACRPVDPTRTEGEGEPLGRRRRGRGRSSHRRYDKDEPRVNERIRVPRVLLIDQDGNKLGEFQTEDALQFAKDKGMDLVEVAPNARPPVAKVADYGKMRYEKQKREAAQRKKSQRTQVKQIKVRPKTDDHDMKVKSRRVHGFLEDGNKVKVVVWFRGREHAHHDIGADQCLRIADAVSDVGEIESHPKMDGRNMVMMLAPSDGSGGD